MRKLFKALKTFVAELLNKKAIELQRPSERLYNALKSAIGDKPLYWPNSDNDATIEAVCIKHDDVDCFRYYQHESGMEYMEMLRRTTNDVRMHRVIQLLERVNYPDDVTMFSKDTGKPSERERLLLVWFGEWFVGIRAYVIES